MSLMHVRPASIDSFMRAGAKDGPDHVLVHVSVRRAAGSAAVVQVMPCHSRFREARLQNKQAISCFAFHMIMCNHEGGVFSRINERRGTL